MKRRYFFLISCVFMLASCTNMSNPIQNSANETWNLSSGSLDGKTFTSDNITLAYQDGVISGNSGINDYRADVKIEGNHFQLTGPLVSTLMAGSTAEMQTEALYLQTLEKVETISRDNTKLTLQGPNCVLEFNLK